MRTFLCAPVLRQTPFVLVQFLLPWNLLSQVPRWVMFRLAPMPASQKSDETFTIPTPLIRLYPATQRESHGANFLQEKHQPAAWGKELGVEKPPAGARPGGADSEAVGSRTAWPGMREADG